MKWNLYRAFALGLSVLCGATIAAAIVSAATTISTNIQTDGNLSVTGTSTFTGYVGISTSTPGSLLSLNNIVNFTAATSTFYSTGGLDLTGGGCFSINEVCVGGGGSSQWSTSGSNIYYATGKVGIATTTPTSLLDIAGTASDTVGGSPMVTLRDASSPTLHWDFRMGTSGGTLSSPFELDSVSGGVAVNRLTINRQSGTVGIGSTTPLAGLTLIGFTPSIWIANSNTANAFHRFQIVTSAYDNSPGTIVAGQYDQNNNALWIGGNRSDEYAATLIQFFTTSATNTPTGTERMRIDGIGDVGINVTNSAVPLQVATSSANATTTVIIGKTGQSKGSCLVMYDAVGTVEYLSIQGGTLVVSSTSCQ